MLLRLRACLLVAVLASGCRGGKSDGIVADEGESEPRLVILGVEGIDPAVLEELIAGGKLPALARLHRSPISTTVPTDPSVAWASFATGLSPSGHGVVGDQFRVPGGYEMQGLYVGRKDGGEPESLVTGEPFWLSAARGGRHVRVLRAPLAYPPASTGKAEILGGSGTPALAGDRGTCLVVSSAAHTHKYPDGKRIRASSRGKGTFEAAIPGPGRDAGELLARIVLTVESGKDGNRTLAVDGGSGRVVSGEGEWSDWLELTFGDGKSEVVGITRFLPRSLGSELEVFMEPVGADPYAPLVPLSAPRYYAGFLADRYGRFRTTGHLVDETAFACGVMGPASLLRQTYVSLEEQERMTLGELGRPGWDLLVSVFTQPAPALTVFSRVGDPSHPAHDSGMDAEFGDSVEKLYVRIDGLVSEIMKVLDASDRLLVVGVRGSGTVTRELNLNAWLVKKGYLVLDRGMRSSTREGFGDVNWSATRAYAAGAGGVYLNISGREPEGSVAAGQEARDLLDGLREELAGIRDGDKPVVRDVLEGAKALGGPAGDRVPDLLVLLEPGYGIGAAERRGTVEVRILQDSSDRWYPRASGADRSAAGGVVLSTFLTRSGGSLLDVAPTVLAFLGLKPSPVHRGRNLW